MANVLGKFGKGVTGAVHLSAARSGGPHCPTQCRHHPDSDSPDATRACYAVRLESLYTSYGRSLKAKEHEPLWRLAGRALVELQGREKRGLPAPTWFRFSVSGNLPPALLPLDVAQMRMLMGWLVSRNVDIHLPIPVADQAAHYRQLFGDLATIRESIQDPANWTSTAGAVSIVVGAKRQKWREKIAAAVEAARERFHATGRRTIVCPAIVSGWRSRWGGGGARKIRCGRKGLGCDACANPAIDVVYPLH